MRAYRVEAFLVLGGLGVTACFGLIQHLLLVQDGATGSVNYISVLGVPLDDVYIHCRYASNLLHGFSYSFNPGQTLTADTSPLWVLLIALGGLFTTRLELVAIILSLLSYLIIAPGVYRASRDVFGLSEFHARVAGWATVFASRLVWSGMSGMETALAALVMLLVVEEHARSRQRECLRAREALWLGLALLVRPEFLFVAAVCAIDWIWLALKKRANVGAAPVVLLLLLTLASSAVLLPLVTQGQLVSHSSVVQGAHVSIIPNVGYLWFALKILASNNVIVFGIFCAGILLLWMDSTFRLAMIIAIGLPILQAFIAPQFRHHGRYFFPVFSLIVILGVSAWSSVEQRTIFLQKWRTVIACAFLLAGLVETGRWSIIEAESVRNINDQHLAVVSWLATNMHPTDRLAVDDVGAIGYFLDKPLIDLTGLVTPSLWNLQHDQDSVWYTARRMGANLFVIYNRLNPAFFDRHKDSLILLKEFRVQLPLASSADTVMSVYRVKGDVHGS